MEVLETPVPGIAPADPPGPGALDRLLAATTDHPDLTVVVGYGQGGNVNDRNDDPQPWTQSVRRRATVEALWVDSTDVRTPRSRRPPVDRLRRQLGGGMFRPGTDDLVALMWASNPICSGYLLGTRLDTAAARDFLAEGSSRSLRPGGLPRPGLSRPGRRGARADSGPTRRC